WAGDRAAGPDADQGICRQAADAANLRGGRRDSATPRWKSLSTARGARLAAPGQAYLETEERPARPRLRSQAGADARATRLRASHSGAMGRICGAVAQTAHGHPRTQLRRSLSRDGQDHAGTA